MPQDNTNTTEDAMGSVDSTCKSDTISEIPTLEPTPTPTKKIKSPSPCLLHAFHESPDINEIGVDEVGRGPLFGRVYAAAVILPKDDSFDHSKMKDSKKFTSKKKIQEVAEYIRENAIAWSVQYEDEKTIDEINILQASQKAMHKSIVEVLKNSKLPHKSVKLLIDGNYFMPLNIYNGTVLSLSKDGKGHGQPIVVGSGNSNGRIEQMDFVCIEGGDNKYSSIAAASILAKVERDKYIEELCLEHPDLIEKYSIDSNKGYGSKKHIEGIKKYGITIWHRRSFGICKNYV